ncbi:MAG: hypothetical protein WDZ35_03345 [Crocinitomicaceae bacterium]
MNKLALPFLLVFTTLLPSVASTQETWLGMISDAMDRKIESDRPGQALTASTCGMMALQVQGGFNFNQIRISESERFDNYFSPLNLRFGLFPKLEINASFYYSASTYHWGQFKSSFNGFPSPEIGLRYWILRGSGWKPDLAFQSSLSFPSNKGTYTQDKAGSSFYLVSSNQFNWFSVNTNLGIVYPGNGGGIENPRFPYVFNLGFDLGDKWSLFSEIFGDIDGSNSSINYDGGIAFNPINSLQLDLFGGYLSNYAGFTHWFIEAGISYRYSFLKESVEKELKRLWGK